MGNEAIVEAALAAGAEALFGYPITPTTEVLQFWAERKTKNKNLIFMQAEDEMAAGFATIGACLAGKKAFDVTAGPGNVLAQDPFSMAEAMRIPIVVIIGQRGGPSTGTVIYSQQEVFLTVHGGNGEGHRIVFSPTTLQELYDFTIEAFNTAWTYFFPTFVLTDGYLCKEKGIVNLHKPQKVVKAKPIFQKGKVLNLRNCYDMEEELYEKIEENAREFNKIALKVAKFEEYKLSDARYVLFAHGSVGASCRVAVDILRQKGIKAGLFIPKTLSPLPENQIKKALLGRKKIFIFESSAGQFSTLLKSLIYGSNLPIFEYLKPALGIMPEEIVNFVKENK